MLYGHRNGPVELLRGGLQKMLGQANPRISNHDVKLAKHRNGLFDHLGHWVLICHIGVPHHGTRSRITNRWAPCSAGHDGPINACRASPFEHGAHELLRMVAQRGIDSAGLGHRHHVLDEWPDLDQAACHEVT